MVSATQQKVGCVIMFIELRRMNQCIMLTKPRVCTCCLPWRGTGNWLWKAWRRVFRQNTLSSQNLKGVILWLVPRFHEHHHSHIESTPAQAVGLKSCPSQRCFKHSPLEVNLLNQNWLQGWHYLTVILPSSNLFRVRVFPKGGVKT